MLLAALCSAEALTHGIVAPRSAARASPPPLAAAKDRPQPPKPSLDLQPAGDAVSDAIAPLLTLEDKGDGFDDVRGALRERQKARRHCCTTRPNMLHIANRSSCSAHGSSPSPRRGGPSAIPSTGRPPLAGQRRAAGPRSDTSHSSSVDAAPGWPRAEKCGLADTTQAMQALMQIRSSSPPPQVLGGEAAALARGATKKD